MAKNFINNPDLYRELCVWLEQVKEAELNNLPRPQMSDYIGSAIMLIAKRLSLKPNFFNYSYREEMVAAGVLNCVKYLHKFNPEKSNNPFSYITEIITNAFIRVIQSEKGYVYDKLKILDAKLAAEPRKRRDTAAMERNDEYIAKWEEAKRQKKERLKAGASSKG